MCCCPTSLFALAASTADGPTRTSASPLCIFKPSGAHFVHLRGRRNSRIMQSRAREAVRESHCYVDDPGLALAATVVWRRKRTLARNLLLLVPGVGIGWMKALLGKANKWLVVALSLPNSQTHRHGEGDRRAPGRRSHGVGEMDPARD